jgi:AcrR family transcriptional regulator
MAKSVRERMVASAMLLLAERGYQGASFTEVLTAARAPRGSIYHHFPDGKDELIALVTTILDFREVPAAVLAAGYHGRWEHETGNQQLKTYLRGPGKVLRSQSPDMVRQEIWGYLLTHYAISALTCAAATAAGIDPDRVKFKRTVRVIRRAVGPAFPP